MDQIKIGKFICTKRKEKNITQSELAESLGISDRAISKWENGICLPDASNMHELCKLLGITINDLFSGEVVDMKNNEKKTEENLLELKRLNEEGNRKLLMLEIFIIIISSISFCLLIIGAELVQDTFVKYIMIIGGIIVLAISIIISFKIEREAGYYECKNCHHKYVPSFKQTFFAMHIGWTKYLKCPKCDKKSWNKKVLTK